jgi:predicted component of type VI protein secretion system
VPYVEALDGPLAGKRFEISKPVILVGSVGDYGGGSNDIVLTDPDGMIAEAQCEIHEKNGKYYLLDCGSEHGTAADGKTVGPDRPATLKNGSRIDLAGVSKLRFGFERKK